MRKFGCGMLATLGLMGVVLGIWFSLSEQSRGIVVGLVVGAAGMLVGIAVALAIVCIFLLSQMHWQVQGAQQPPPIVMGYLPAPPAQSGDEWSGHPPPAQPAWNRPVRGFRIIGGDDRPPPGTVPPGQRPAGQW